MATCNRKHTTWQEAEGDVLSCPVCGSEQIAWEPMHYEDYLNLDCECSKLHVDDYVWCDGCGHLSQDNRLVAFYGESEKLVWEGCTGKSWSMRMLRKIKSAARNL